MSGECDQCGEHVLDCFCNYPFCQKCKNIIYRDDHVCVRCLVNESKELIGKTSSKLKKFREAGLFWQGDDEDKIVVVKKKIIHEVFKERLADMAHNLIYDFTQYYGISSDDDCEIMEVDEFIEKWVDKHIKETREDWDP